MLKYLTVRMWGDGGRDWLAKQKGLRKRLCKRMWRKNQQNQEVKKKRAANSFREDKMTENTRDLTRMREEVNIQDTVKEKRNQESEP